MKHAQFNTAVQISTFVTLFALHVDIADAEEGQVIKPFAVVARVDQELRGGEKAIAKAKKGDILTAYREYKDLYAVKDEDGKIGWVAQSDVATFQEALGVFDELIKDAPQNGRLYALRGFSRWGRNEPEAAIEDYSRAINLGDKSGSIYEYRAMCYSLIGEHKKALADYSVAMNRGRASASLLASRAAAYLAEGKFAEGIKDYDAVLEQEPKRADIYYQRAVAKKSLGAMDEAIADFSSAIEVDPAYVEALNGRGFAWFQQGDPKKAIADFSAVIKLNPQSPLALNNRGYNRQLLGDYNGAIEDYAAAIRIESDYILAHQNLAWLLATAGDAKVRNGKFALKAATKVCELTKYEDFASLRVLAAAYAEAGDYADAVKWQRKAIELSPEEHKTEEQESLAKYVDKQPVRIVSLAR